jgi:hypothetical protein
MFWNTLNAAFFATGGNDDTLTKMLEGWDLTAVKGTISGVVRAVGFGPEADSIATAILGVFVVLVMIGYAAGPRNQGQENAGSKDDKNPDPKK